MTGTRSRTTTAACPFDLQHPRHRRAFLGLMGAGAATLGGAAAARVRLAVRPPRPTRRPRSRARPPARLPADGSNGPDALGESGIVRRNIRRSFGSSTTRAAGAAASSSGSVVDTAEPASPLVGYAVYAWHCDRDGRVLHVRLRRHRRELPARRPGHQPTRGVVPVQEHLSRLLLRPLAAHPFRGLPQRVRGDRRRWTPVVTSQLALPPHLARRRSTARWRATQQSVNNLQPGLDQLRPGLRRRRRRPTSWPRSRAASPRGSRPGCVPVDGG